MAITIAFYDSSLMMAKLSLACVDQLGVGEKLLNYAACVAAAPRRLPIKLMYGDFVSDFRRSDLVIFHRHGGSLHGKSWHYRQEQKRFLLIFHGVQTSLFLTVNPSLWTRINSNGMENAELFALITWLDN